MAWGRSRRLGGVTAKLGLLKAWGILSEASTEGSEDCWDPGSSGHHRCQDRGVQCRGGGWCDLRPQHKAYRLRLVSGPRRKGNALPVRVRLTLMSSSITEV